MAWAGCSISALVPPSRLGAIMIWGSRLVGEANVRTSSVVRLGMSVGRTRTLGCAVGRGVAGRLGQGGVELWFRLGVIGAAGRRGCARLTFFGQRMAVAADDEDLGVKMGLADGRQGAGEQFAVEGAPLPGRDMAGEAAFAFVEGLDGNDCPQAHCRVRWSESNGCTLFFPFRGLAIGASHTNPMDAPYVLRFLD